MPLRCAWRARPACQTPRLVSCRRRGVIPERAGSSRVASGVSLHCVCVDGASATQKRRSRRCGAPTLAAGAQKAPAAYPPTSSEPRTPANQSSPPRPATCSPKTTGGRHSAMRRSASGQRCLSSSTHSWRQAAQQATPVRPGCQTRAGLSIPGMSAAAPRPRTEGKGNWPTKQVGRRATRRGRGRRASLRSRRRGGRGRIPGGRRVAHPRCSDASTSPPGRCSAAMSLRSQAPAKASLSL